MLCRFYQRGNCKFGDSCRYVHEDYSRNDGYHGYDRSGYNQEGYSSYNRGGDGSHYQNKKPQYNSVGYNYNNQENYRHSGQGSYRQNNHFDSHGHNRYKPLDEGRSDHRRKESEPAEPSLEDYMDVMQTEMTEWINSSMWPLSCYGPCKYSTSLPGLDDFSAEEVRFVYIQAMPEGRLADYINWLSGIFNSNSRCRKQLSQVNYQQKAHVLDLIRKSLSERNDGNKLATNNFMKCSQEPSFDSDAFQNPSSHGNIAVFGAVNQGFGQTPLQQPGFFQQPQQQTNIFQQSQQHGVSNPFNHQPEQPHSLSFQQQQHQEQQLNSFFKSNQTQNAFSSFSSPLNPPTIFGSMGGNGFAGGSSGDSSQTFGSFPKPGSAFGREVLKMTGDFYTKMDALSEEDVKEFKSESFNFIPAFPPPKELL